MPKKILCLLLAANILTACSSLDKKHDQQAEDTIIAGSEHKHKSEKLPVDIYVDSSYKIEGMELEFSRSISSVEWKKFDEKNKMDFLSRYDNTVRKKNYNYLKDFKLLVINMEHHTDRTARSKPFQRFIFNEGSGLVLGDIELNEVYEFLDYQQMFMSKKYRTDTSTNEKGNILLAVPKEIANNDLLQLKINKNSNNENETIFIDLN